jgi:pumilio family protein 6
MIDHTNNPPILHFSARMSKMAGTKRKEAPSGVVKSEKKQKTSESKSAKVSKSAKPEKTSKVEKTAKPAKKPSHLEAAANADDDDKEEEFNGISEEDTGINPERKEAIKSNGKSGGKDFKLDGSSAEAHAKQRQLAKERRAAKPNADAIQRSKQLWEQLRRKSHVPKEERNKLLTELFTIIDGRVRDFVFKHDSVRVIQCAIKYARAEQLKGIVKELKNDVRDLVESRYGKFLVAKMVMQGDREDKDIIIPQFYGQIKRLINHPEASWIVDDIYRQVATPQQKDMMLREWYGTEFALFGKEASSGQRRFGDKPSEEDSSADLRKILEASPEKRKPILGYLKQMINNLIQKKMTGFTMLHDAMLQYFLSLETGTEEHSEFLEILKGDIDAEEENGGGDLFRNLAFTKSGSRLVCLTLAHGSAKDRKVILKCFKDNIELMACDQHAKMVLIAGLDCPDDTRNALQAILRELLGLQLEDPTQRFDRLEALTSDLNARLPLFYPIAGPTAKWLLKPEEKSLLAEIHDIRKSTSKKAPEVRRQELIAHVSDSFLHFVADRAANLVRSSFACQPVSDILLECTGPHREAAKLAVAELAAGNPLEEDHIAQDPAAGRMLKTLVSGGTFDTETKTVKMAEPRLGFGEALYPVINDHIVEWASSESSFVVVALLESEEMGEGVKKEVKAALKKGRKELIEAAEKGSRLIEKEKGDGEEAEEEEVVDGGKKKKKERKTVRKNAGARILLEKI